MGVELVPWLTESVAKCIDNYILSDNRLSQGEILNRLHTVQLLNSPDKPVFLQLVERDQLLLSDSCVKIRANFARKCQLPEGTIISLHQAKLSIVRLSFFLILSLKSPLDDVVLKNNRTSNQSLSRQSLDIHCHCSSLISLPYLILLAHRMLGVLCRYQKNPLCNPYFFACKVSLVLWKTGQCVPHLHQIVRLCTVKLQERILSTTRLPLEKSEMSMLTSRPKWYTITLVTRPSKTQ